MIKDFLKEQENELHESKSKPRPAFFYKNSFRGTALLLLSIYIILYSAKKNGPRMPKKMEPICQKKWSHMPKKMERECQKKCSLTAKKNGFDFFRNAKKNGSRLPKKMERK